eukprot:gene15197-21272_t
MRQAKNLGAAIKLVTMNSRAVQGPVTSGHAVYDAFSFMDPDKTGLLNEHEMKDSFFALGVTLSDDVSRQIFQTFDKEGKGAVKYQDLVSAMFPITRTKP